MYSSTKEQNRFCLEAKRVGEEKEGVEGVGRSGTNNVCTYE
jgi:hypothetical protein